MSNSDSSGEREPYERWEQEQDELHLAQVAFEADRAYVAKLRVGEMAAEHTLDWEYHVALRTPLVARYRAMALAVRAALSEDRDTAGGGGAGAEDG